MWGLILHLYLTSKFDVFRNMEESLPENISVLFFRLITGKNYRLWISIEYPWEEMLPFGVPGCLWNRWFTHTTTFIKFSLIEIDYSLSMFVSPTLMLSPPPPPPLHPPLNRYWELLYPDLLLYTTILDNIYREKYLRNLVILICYYFCIRYSHISLRVPGITWKVWQPLLRDKILE